MSASDRSTGGQKASKPAAPAGRTVETDGSSSPPAQNSSANGPTQSDNRSNGGAGAAGAAAGIGAGLLAAIIAGLLLGCMLLFGVALIAGMLISEGRAPINVTAYGGDSSGQTQWQQQKQKQSIKLCGSCGKKSHKGDCKKKKASTTKVQTSTSTRYVRKTIVVRGKTKVIYVPQPAKDARRDQEGKPETVPNGDDNPSTQMGGDVAPSEETSGS